MCKLVGRQVELSTAGVAARLAVRRATNFRSVCTVPSGVSKFLRVTREQIAHRAVRRAKDDEQVGVALLDQALVGPGKRRTAAVQIDVRAQHAAQSRRGGAGRDRCRKARAFLAGEQGRQLRAQASCSVGVGRAGVCRRPRRAVEIVLDLHLPASSKAIVVEKPALVQVAHQLFDHLQIQRLARTARRKSSCKSASVRVPSMSEASSGRGIGQHDRAGKALGIAQGKHHLAARLADRKALDADASEAGSVRSTSWTESCRKTMPAASGGR